MFMKICERFPCPYEYVYFTYSYIGRIFLDVDILHRISRTIDKLKIVGCLGFMAYQPLKII